MDDLGRVETILAAGGLDRRMRHSLSDSVCGRCREHQRILIIRETGENKVATKSETYYYDVRYVLLMIVETQC